ncbi:hypothetical protein [Thermosulfurimonas sp. F29]|uniref:hypothetical protein n=1 Tax=Thermosulfurimonas sp. F29 TaxID=2867247 RepID=UPI001C82B649|nr:hypothetical protein [Thermosulfurimonas sp. F29]MBX6423397.1 hypothetical protein [Thermosulfurimonas sp. F29]
MFFDYKNRSTVKSEYEDALVICNHVVCVSLRPWRFAGLEHRAVNVLSLFAGETEEELIRTCAEGWWRRVRIAEAIGEPLNSVLRAAGAEDKAVWTLTDITPSETFRRFGAASKIVIHFSFPAAAKGVPVDAVVTASLWARLAGDWWLVESTPVPLEFWRARLRLDQKAAAKLIEEFCAGRVLREGDVVVRALEWLAPYLDKNDALAEAFPEFDEYREAWKQFQEELVRRREADPGRYLEVCLLGDRRLEWPVREAEWRVYEEVRRERAKQSVLRFAAAGLAVYAVLTAATTTQRLWTLYRLHERRAALERETNELARLKEDLARRLGDVSLAETYLRETARERFLRMLVKALAGCSPEHLEAHWEGDRPVLVGRFPLTEPCWRSLESLRAVVPGLVVRVKPDEGEVTVSSYSLRRPRTGKPGQGGGGAARGSRLH